MKRTRESPEEVAEIEVTVKTIRMAHGRDENRQIFSSSAGDANSCTARSVRPFRLQRTFGALPQSLLSRQTQYFKKLFDFMSSAPPSESGVSAHLPLQTILLDEHDGAGSKILACLFSFCDIATKTTCRLVNKAFLCVLSLSMPEVRSALDFVNLAASLKENSTQLLPLWTAVHGQIYQLGLPHLVEQEMRKSLANDFYGYFESNDEDSTESNTNEHEHKLSEEETQVLQEALTFVKDRSQIRILHAFEMKGRENASYVGKLELKSRTNDILTLSNRFTASFNSREGVHDIDLDIRIDHIEDDGLRKRLEKSMREEERSDHENRIPYELHDDISLIKINKFDSINQVEIKDPILLFLKSELGLSATGWTPKLLRIFFALLCMPYVCMIRGDLLKPARECDNSYMIMTIPHERQNELHAVQNLEQDSLNTLICLSASFAELQCQVDNGILLDTLYFIAAKINMFSCKTEADISACGMAQLFCLGEYSMERSLDAQVWFSRSSGMNSYRVSKFIADPYCEGVTKQIIILSHSNSVIYQYEDDTRNGGFEYWDTDSFEEFCAKFKISRDQSRSHPDMHRFVESILSSNVDPLLTAFQCGIDNTSLPMLVPISSTVDE